MVGEVVRITPWNAVESDVELTVLETANADRLAFGEAGPVRRYVGNAWRDLDRLVVIA